MCLCFCVREGEIGEEIERNSVCLRSKEREREIEREKEREIKRQREFVCSRSREFNISHFYTLMQFSYFTREKHFKILRNLVCVCV